jgi:hypothetical protein
MRASQLSSKDCREYRSRSKRSKIMLKHTLAERADVDALPLMMINRLPKEIMSWLSKPIRQRALHPLARPRH